MRFAVRSKTARSRNYRSEPGLSGQAILNVTLAELKPAPDFQYAQSPLAETDTQPAGGGETVLESVLRRAFSDVHSMRNSHNHE
jgi:hypothetical protein